MFLQIDKQFIIIHILPEYFVLIITDEKYRFNMKFHLLHTQKFIITLLLFISGCNGDNEPCDFDSGKITGSTYTNNYFGFKVNIPETWSVRSGNELRKISDEVAETADQNTKETIKSGQQNTSFLLSLFKYGPNEKTEYNPSLIVLSENLKNASRIRTGSDYLKKTRALLLQSESGYVHIDDTPATTRIGGQDFFYINAKANGIHQTYYSKVTRDYSLTIILSYLPAQKDELEEILQSITFFDLAEKTD